jgi:ABC-type Fe3+-hydroxamate transport system substrate-binding protein
MPIFEDQLNNKILISGIPQRIVSLVPSQTELLFDLGLDQEVLGITKYCVHPTHWLKSKKIIGGTKNFDFEVIHSLKPDLVIGNKEENYQEGIEMLGKDYPVWMSDIITLEDAFAMIERVGTITSRSYKSELLNGEIKIEFEKLQTCLPRTALYLIWRKPWMAASADTFIHSMLNRIGLQNCLQDQSRYPVLTAEDITTLNPEMILLSSEPFPFSEKHIAELQQLCPASQIILVDGEMFSWYGSRLRYAPQYFASLPLPWDQSYSF